MARDVDDVIEFIESRSYIPPVHKQVMINRLNSMPTKAELDQAHEQLYPKRINKIIDIGPECFTADEGEVISYKGENYYKACGFLVTGTLGGPSTSCVKRVNHPGGTHEDFFGNKKERDPRDPLPA